MSDPAENDTDAATAEGDADPDADADTDPAIDSDTPPDTGTGPPLETFNQASARYTALFDPSVVHDVRIDLDAASWDALQRDGTVELLATVTIDGEVLPGAGLELTGPQAAFGWDGKVDLRVDFDTVVDGMTYGGMEHLRFDDQADDPTGVREVLASRVLHAGGVALPYAGFATVVIQGSAPLLYTVREEVDEAFIQRTWIPTGDLWEGNDGADFTVAGLPAWSGDGDPATLEAARVAIQTSGADFETEVGAVIALDQLRSVWAWQAVIGNPDGWPYELDDVWLYADPAQLGQFVFIPERIDEAFDPATVWDAVAAEVAVRCRYDPACSAALEAEIRAVADTYEALVPRVWAEEALALTEAHVLADPERGFLPGEIAAARAALPGIVAGRAEAVRAGLP